MIILAPPVADRGELDLVERHWRHAAVDRGLDQLLLHPRDVRLGAHPFGGGRALRPDHDRCPGRADLVGDDLAIGEMRRQLVVPPDAVAEPLHRLGELAHHRLIAARIRDEDVGHPLPLAQFLGLSTTRMRGEWRRGGGTGFAPVGWPSTAKGGRKWRPEPARKGPRTAMKGPADAAVPPSPGPATGPACSRPPRSPAPP